MVFSASGMGKAGIDRVANMIVVGVLVYLHVRGDRDGARGSPGPVDDCCVRVLRDQVDMLEAFG